MNEAAYQAMRAMQGRHWWYQGRQEVVANILEQSVKSYDLKILDLGSGFGGMVSLLRPLGVVDAVEPNVAAWEYLRRESIVEVYSDVESIPPERKENFDLVTMFDVMEHIEDDYGIAKKVYTELLISGGTFLLTVPANPWMWGFHDEINHHYRRYTPARLRSVLEDAGFIIERQTFFMKRLFPIAVAGRLMAKLRRGSSPGLSTPPRLLNRLLYLIFHGEVKHLRSKDYSYGLSLLCVARKP